jgi:hypothetical protein
MIEGLDLHLSVDKVGTGGADPGRLAGQAAVLTPAHQYPRGVVLVARLSAGVVLVARHRSAFVDWARRGDGFIVEDDYEWPGSTGAPTNRLVLSGPGDGIPQAPQILPAPRAPVLVLLPSPPTTSMLHRCGQDNIDAPSMWVAAAGAAAALTLRGAC